VTVDYSTDSAGIAAFAGYLGRNIFESMRFEELLSEGVIMSLVVRDGHPTPLSTIIVKPDGKRTTVTDKGSTPVLEPDQVYFTAVRPRAILFDGHHRQAVGYLFGLPGIRIGTLDIFPQSETPATKVR
jgi:sulfofructose kinase